MCPRSDKSLAQKRDLCDFLLVIALREEFEYFLKAFNLVYESHTTEDRVPYYRFHLPASQNNNAQGAVGFIGDMGIEEANIFTFQLLSELNPGLVANIGISGIVDDQLKLGDVVIATEADDYLHRGKIQQSDPNAKLTFADLKFGGKSYATTVSLCDVLDNLEFSDPDSWQAWLKQSQKELKSGLSAANLRQLEKEKLIGEQTRAYAGPVAAGPWVGAAAEFKKLLKTHNRNYLAMDMESSGVLQVANKRLPIPQTVVLRGISDPADERKALLDNMDTGALRRWAMLNALRLFAVLIKKIDLDSYSRRHIEAEPPTTTRIGKDQLAEKIHPIVLQEYLDAPYNNAAYIGEGGYDRFGALFAKLSQSPQSSPLELLARSITSTATAESFWVEGPPGTGKTSLLSVLYWYFLEQRGRDKDSPLPVFINLHRYNELTPRSGDSSPMEDQAVTALRRHLEPLAAIIEEDPTFPLLVIVDGYDAYSRYRDQTSSALFDLLRKSKHWQIIGSREQAGQSSSYVDTSGVQAAVSLAAIKSDGPIFPGLIDSFLIIMAPGGEPALGETLRQLIKKWKLKTVDLFTLSLVFDQAKNIRNVSSKDLSGLLEDYCQKFLRRRLSTLDSKSELLERAGSIAFSYAVKQTKTIPEKGETLWELVNRHATICDYLAARHLIQDLVKNAEGNAKKTISTLRYVFTHRVNRFCKELLNRDQATQLQVVKAIDGVLKRDKGHAYAKAQACYLAGRVDDDQARIYAREVLTRFRDLLRKKPLQQDTETQIKMSRLVMRTLYISLGWLGEKSAHQQYIETLLSDRESDMFNRGFHLEYYGDQAYTPAQMLASEDRLGPCPKTFDQLLLNLTDEGSPMFDIELYTLCSLAQHRHAAGKLDQGYRERLMTTIDDLLRRHKVNNTTLRNYVTMIRKHLGHKNFHIGRIFDDYYQIKRVKRTGWVTRGIPDCESVADHSYGAYLLALYLLPDSWKSESPNDKYDKPTIMNMLLIHDLAEAITGDVLPRDSNEESKRREREVYEEIALLGTYEGLARMREIGELWKDFEAQVSLNARVAKDLDKLENLVQLWVYKKAKREIQDYDNWAQELIEAVNTEPGRQVLGKLQASQGDKD